MSNLKIIILILLLYIYYSPTYAGDPPFVEYKYDTWVTETLDRMTIEEKIAQLMIITAYPNQNEASKLKVIEQIKEYKPGGVLIMQGFPTKTATWINQFQDVTRIPLLMAIDGEWGPAMRIDSTINYPYAQTIGAIQDTTFVYEMGRDIGSQLKQLGIHMNFAPVADINTNPKNPVINFRSFGEDKKNVAEKAWMIAKGMQDVGVIPVAKHFPGHGDTKTDSHKALPILQHSKSRMDRIETFPFRYLSDKGISGIMSAHISVPSLDRTGKPASISKNIVTDYLKDEIGFNGFVVTDAINMKGVRTETGRTELEALQAGNDLIEFVPDISKAIKEIKNALDNNEIRIEDIDKKCRTMLALKRWLNLHEYQPTKTKNLTSRINSPYYEVTNRKLIKGSFTILQNINTFPIQNLESHNIATLTIGANEISTFQQTIRKYTKTDQFFLSKTASEKEWLQLRKKLENYSLVLVGMEGINIYPSKSYGTSEIQKRATEELVQDNNAIFVFFGNAYALKQFNNIQHAKGLILAYQNNQLTQELAAQAIFGAFDISGKLPVTIDRRFKINDGIELKKNHSFSYTIPEEVKINSTILHHMIDSIAKMGIEESAYPGCQVLIAKEGNIIFHKCYGYHTYSNIQSVQKNDIYDWASITKVTGPLPALMKLVDQEKINLDNPFSAYWPDFKNSNKKNLKFREILSHQARLEPWIPFWTTALNEKKELDKKIFKNKPSEKFNIRVSYNLYMNEDFLINMFDTICTSELKTRKRYLYSGLSFYLYPKMIENFTGREYESYLKNTFYKPLGAYTITFNAYKHFPLKQIIPTEKDDFFRMTQIKGFVHDEGASMMGGISGNAGLFGNTNDLAKVFQMYLQKGFYGGKRYISEKTIKEFTRIQYPNDDNRRGLGFDKPLIDNHKNELRDAYPAVSSSKNSFGHSGFTGTFAWADPDFDLLFIFMSNRVYPTRENQKLYELNIRTAMHQAIYDCIKTGLN